MNEDAICFVKRSSSEVIELAKPSFDGSIVYYIVMKSEKALIKQIKQTNVIPKDDRIHVVGKR